MEEAPSQGFIFCARCKTRNPKGAELCQNCGFVFGHSTLKAPLEPAPQQPASPQAPTYPQPVVKQVALQVAAEPPPLSLSFEPPEVNIYRPKVKNTEGDILPGRPGLITLYIAYLVFQMVASGLLVFTTENFLFQTSYFWWLNDLSFEGVLVVLMVGTALTVITSVGLWQMKDWGRRLAIIAQVAVLGLQVGVTLIRLSSGLPFAVFWSEMLPLEALRFTINVWMLWWLISNGERFD